MMVIWAPSHVGIYAVIVTVSETLGLVVQEIMLLSIRVDFLNASR